MDSLCSQLEELIANLKSTLDEYNGLLDRNQHLEFEMNHWKNLCTEAERAGKKLAMKADKEIRGLKESLSEMTLPLELLV